ncbi:putative metal-dependent hydrolase [bacterium]|nr:putative metal-dependent hydrolase [bacterium]
MPHDQRKTHIETLRAFPTTLEQAVAGLNDEQLDTPYGPGKWTIRQLVHHLADSHANGAARVRWALAEETPAVKAYDQDEWSRLYDARRAPIEPSLAIIRGLHQRLVILFESLDDEQFDRTMHHPENGEVSIDDWIRVYAGHCNKHLGHITGLREARGW